MLLPEKACFGKGKTTLHNLTMVGLRGDAATLAGFANTLVLASGKLSNAGPDADPQVVLTVTTVQALKVE